MNIQGLYAITDPGLIADERLLDVVAEVIAGGARVVQYRNKNADPPVRLQQARALQLLCKDHGVVFIVNDDPGLAVSAGADGVHVGRNDLQLSRARDIVGRERLVGVSCYNDLDRAMSAQTGGADYVAFGSFFASPTKPGADRVGIELLRRARRRLHVPIVAIGGITLENGGELIAAGADALAVIHAVFAAKNRQSAAARLAGLFTYRD